MGGIQTSITNASLGQKGRFLALKDKKRVPLAGKMGGEGRRKTERERSRVCKRARITHYNGNILGRS